MEIDQRIRDRILSARKRLTDEAKIPDAAQLKRYSTAFQQRFAPAALSNLDGTALLMAMHGRQTRDSMMYWLEFKNDDEFQTLAFGGIGGGSALKFGLFQRADDGAWVTGTTTNMQQISIEEATALARKQRDQLLAGVSLLQRLPPLASDDQYLKLQQDMDTLAPDVNDSSWAHKYFSLLFPDKLDDYHVQYLQRFHLIKMLQLPPADEGRYLMAGRYVAISQELGITLNTLAAVLNVLDLPVHRYWRAGSVYKDNDLWPLMREHNALAVGWSETGPLTDFTYDDSSKQRLKDRLQQAYPNHTPQTLGRDAQQPSSLSMKSTVEIARASSVNCSRSSR